MEIRKNLVKLRTFFISFFRNKKNVRAISGIAIFLFINWVIRLIEFEIFLKIPRWEAFTTIFFVSFVLRYLMIIIYDYREEDSLLIEMIKKDENLVKEKQNFVTRKIIQLKKRRKNYFYIGLVSFDPVVTVLYFRDGYYKWNNFSNLKVFILFVLSVLTCTILFFFGSLVIEYIVFLFIILLKIIWTCTFFLGKIISGTL